MTKRKSKDDVKKIYCRECKQPTNHRLLFQKKVRDQNEEAGLWFISTYKTLQCSGCETICLLEEYLFSEDIDPHTGEPELQIKIYPNPHKNREEIKETYYLPEKIRNVYKETVHALNQNLSILAGVGLRTIIEAICKDKKITKGFLKQKINALVKMGLMTNEEAKMLHLNRYIGNAATHDIIETPIDELKTGLDIIVATLQNTYILPRKAEAIKTRLKSKSKK